MEHFSIPYGIIINKHDINPEKTREIEDYAGDKLIARIPYDRRFSEALVRLVPAVSYCKEFERIFQRIADRVVDIVKQN